MDYGKLVELLRQRRDVVNNNLNELSDWNSETAEVLTAELKALDDALGAFLKLLKATKT